MPYDNAYHAQNRQAFFTDTWRPGHPDHTLITGKIEDHEQEFYGEDVFYYMNDVHYYLADWTPKNRKPND